MYETIYTMKEKYHNPWCKHTEMLMQMYAYVQNTRPNSPENEFFRQEVHRAIEGVTIMRLHQQIKLLEEEVYELRKVKQELNTLNQSL